MGETVFPDDPVGSYGSATAPVSDQSAKGATHPKEHFVHFLSDERDTLALLLPGLDQQLQQLSLQQLESRRSPGVDLFRQAGGAGLLVRTEHGGAGATPLQMVRLQRALSSRSPSLAIATTMHHFSVASLVEMSRQSSGPEWMLLEAVAGQRLLLASGFAEGRTGQNVLVPTMRGRLGEDGLYRISGTKKPCSLAWSMDLLTASAAIEMPDGSQEFAVVVVPAGRPGMRIEEFWTNDVLAGAESDAVVLEDVELEPDLVIRSDTSGGQRLDDLQVSGFLWFELLMSACYIGMASNLVERALESSRTDARVRVDAAVELESAMSAVEGVALRMTDGERGTGLLNRALACRYAAQDAIGRAVGSAVEQLGGMAFIGSPDISYFASASRGLAFHPPARLRMAEQMASALKGAPLEIA